MVRTGRPPKPDAERRDVVLRLRLTRGEYQKLLSEAKKAGMPFSQYARKKLGGKA